MAQLRAAVALNECASDFSIARVQELMPRTWPPWAPESAALAGRPSPPL